MQGSSFLKEKISPVNVTIRLQKLTYDHDLELLCCHNHSCVSLNSLN